jgi:large subunit ribosomal protein L39
LSETASQSTPITNSSVIKKRNELFEKEYQRQESLVTRVEKIKIEVKGPPEDVVLVMNKRLSTPYNCAMHIHQSLLQRAVVAEVNGEPWDMHRPLVDDCTLEFRHFKEADPFVVNKAFWRTGSFLLGYAAERVFKDSFYVELHSWPAPDISSGSFVYDVDLKISNWKPTLDELNTVSMVVRKLCLEDMRFQRMEVDVNLALKMFQDNRFKVEQIPRIASHSVSENTVTLYRLDDHVDISYGPMISSTSQIAKFHVTAAIPVETSCGLLYRIQAVGLPTQIPLNYFAFSVLCDRAKKLNRLPLPKQPA